MDISIMEGGTEGELSNLDNTDLDESNYTM